MGGLRNNLNGTVQKKLIAGMGKHPPSWNLKAKREGGKKCFNASTHRGREGTVPFKAISGKKGTAWGR